MRMTKIISTLIILFLGVKTASGQSILKNYFKGNKDSMVMENSKANIHIIEGVTHNGIRQNPQAYLLIKKWFSAL